MIFIGLAYGHLQFSNIGNSVKQTIKSKTSNSYITLDYIVLHKTIYDNIPIPYWAVQKIHKKIK